MFSNPILDDLGFLVSNVDQFLGIFRALALQIQVVCSIWKYECQQGFGDVVEHPSTMPWIQQAIAKRICKVQ